MSRENSDCCKPDVKQIENIIQPSPSAVATNFVFLGEETADLQPEFDSTFLKRAVAVFSGRGCSQLDMGLTKDGVESKCS